MRNLRYYAAVALRNVLCLMMTAVGATTMAQTIELAKSVTELRGAVLARIQALHADQRMRLVVPFGDGLFPPDDTLADYGDQEWPHGAAQWRALPPTARSLDLLLIPNEDYYWPVAGEREFRCNFIVHFESLKPGHSRMTVMQVHATTRHGKRFDLFGRTGPGWYWDIRPSRPKAQASADLVATIIPDH